MIKLLTQDDTVNLSKFISREQLSPTAAYHLVHEQVISPLHSHLTRLIAAWTGCDANDTRMILCGARFVRTYVILRGMHKAFVWCIH